MHPSAGSAQAVCISDDSLQPEHRSVLPSPAGLEADSHPETWLWKP